MTDMTGKVCWTELNGCNIEKSRAFYATTLGWTYDIVPMEDGQGTYTLCKLGDEVVAGMYDISDMEMLRGVPDHWFTYFAVADIEASVETVKVEGGEVRRPPFVVPGTGTIAIVADTTGAVMGLMQPDAM